jgi:hypothetical protein
MAHFAQLDKDNVVIQVIVVHNNEAPDEATGITFCQSLYGADTVWKQTSYNTRGGVHYGDDNMPDSGIAFRKNFAGIGAIYDPIRDAFIPAQAPHPSWQLNEDSCLYEAPIPYPTDGKRYYWVEADQNWQVL